MIGIILAGVLIGVATNVRSFITEGAALAGFGNFNTFAYPATYVYMLIPAVCSVIYSIILALDGSPQYKSWQPSKTLRSSISLFAGTIFLSAVLPLVPGADVITEPDSALQCTWTDYMQWRTIFANPDVYPWVVNMDKACVMLKVADAFAWILCIGWLALVGLYFRAARNQTQTNEKNGSWPLTTLNPGEKPTTLTY
ncbi:hypothetical protein DFQ29_000929 [Apophysomyces sp. BC1021]|nr:hypothetical protein DFQ29_000929 [Apophysomyces sp. BC1021]